MALRRRESTRILAGGALLFLLLVAGYFVFVRTAPGQGWDNLAYGGRPKFGQDVTTYDSDILGDVSKRTILIAMGALFAISLALRRPVVGIVAILAMGFAIFGAEFFKHSLPRPLLSPTEVPVPNYFAMDTYPSGHTTIGTSVALALLVIMGPLLRPWSAVLAGVTSASFATAVFFMGWHRPSDAIGGILWSGACFAVAASVLVLIHGHHAPQVRNFSGPVNAVLAAMAIIAIGLTISLRSGSLNLPFFAMTAAILVAGFALPVWLVAALARIDWRSTQRQELRRHAP